MAIDQETAGFRNINGSDIRGQATPLSPACSGLQHMGSTIWTDLTASPVVNLHRFATNRLGPVLEQVIAEQRFARPDRANRVARIDSDPDNTTAFLAASGDAIEKRALVQTAGSGPL